MSESWKVEKCVCMYFNLCVSPVYNGTHIQADILKSSQNAFLQRMQIGRLVVQ